MADIQYLNYGDQQIEQQAFLDKAKKEVYDYVRKQPWSTKRKERFMSAYSDIMTRGVLGASVDDKTGLYKIQVGGDVMNISPDDQKIYGDAAAYLQEQMASLPTRASLEEEAKKKAEEEKAKLPIFDNEYFKTNFINHLSKNEFGGSKQFDTQNDWNGLDKRDEKTGLRGREERARILARNLQSYADSLDETKLNFEGSPFENLQDFKDRINKAVYALTETPDNIDDDNESLRRLGIRASDWFNNGSGDPSGKYDETGRELTYAELAQHNQEQENKKLAAQKQAAYDNTLFINRVTSPKMQGRNPVELKEKYKDNNSLLTALQGYAQQDIRSLTPDEISEVHGAYRNLANAPIDSKLLNQLQNSSSGLYKNSAPNRFKKINGIDNLVWDSVAGQVIQINNRQQQQAVQTQPQDLFKGIKTQEELNKEKSEAQQKYLNNTEWTSDQKRELAGIVADVASVIDPEPFTAGGLALTGTGLRTYNRATDADGFTWSDIGHTALDTGLSLLGMIPVVGDAALAARVVGKLQKAAGWLGAAFAATSVPQAAKAAWNKVVNGQDMTVDDWRAIGNVLMGATQARRIQLNRAAGNAVKNQGGTTTKEKIGEVEVKINGKTEKVEIDEASAKELQQAYKAAGSDQKATTEALRKSRKVREQLEAKKTSDGKPAYTKEQLDAIEAPQAASGSLRGKSPIQGLRDTRGIKITERSVQTSGTPLSELNLGPLAQMRLNAIQNNKGWFNRGDFGWNMRGKGSEQQSSGWLSRTWQNLKNPYKPKVQKQQEVPNQQPTQQPTQQSTQQPTQSSTNIPKSKTEIRRDWKNTIERKQFTTNELQSGEYNITNPKDSKYNVNVKVSEKDSEGFRTLIINGSDPIKIKTQKQLQEKIAKAMQSYRNTVNNSKNKAGINHKEIGKILRDLKAKGWLKEGGKIIDKQKIQKYKNFINK